LSSLKNNRNLFWEESLQWSEIRRWLLPYHMSLIYSIKTTTCLSFKELIIVFGIWAICGMNPLCRGWCVVWTVAESIDMESGASAVASLNKQLSCNSGKRSLKGNSEIKHVTEHASYLKNMFSIPRPSLLK
jgi:hypothetical protein